MNLAIVRHVTDHEVAVYVIRGDDLDLRSLHGYHCDPVTLRPTHRRGEVVRVDHYNPLRLDEPVTFVGYPTERQVECARTWADLYRFSAVVGTSVARDQTRYTGVVTRET